MCYNKNKTRGVREDILRGDMSDKKELASGIFGER